MGINIIDPFITAAGQDQCTVRKLVEEKRVFNIRRYIGYISEYRFGGDGPFQPVILSDQAGKVPVMLEGILSPFPVMKTKVSISVFPCIYRVRVRVPGFKIHNPLNLPTNHRLRPPFPNYAAICFFFNKESFQVIPSKNVFLTKKYRSIKSFLVYYTIYQTTTGFLNYQTCINSTVYM